MSDTTCLMEGCVGGSRGNRAVLVEQIMVELFLLQSDTLLAGRTNKEGSEYSSKTKVTIHYIIY